MMMDYWDSLELHAASVILNQLWLSGTVPSIVSTVHNCVHARVCVRVLTHMYAHIISAAVAHALNQTKQTD